MFFDKTPCLHEHTKEFFSVRFHYNSKPPLVSQHGRFFFRYYTTIDSIDSIDSIDMPRRASFYGGPHGPCEMTACSVLIGGLLIVLAIVCVIVAVRSTLTTNTRPKHSDRGTVFEESLVESFATQSCLTTNRATFTMGVEQANGAVACAALKGTVDTTPASPASPASPGTPGTPAPTPTSIAPESPVTLLTSDHIPLHTYSQECFKENPPYNTQVYLYPEKPTPPAQLQRGQSVSVQLPSGFTRAEAKETYGITIPISPDGEEGDPLSNRRHMARVVTFVANNAPLYSSSSSSSDGGESDATGTGSWAMSNGQLTSYLDTQNPVSVLDTLSVKAYLNQDNRTPPINAYPGGTGTGQAPPLIAPYTNRRGNGYVVEFIEPNLQAYYQAKGNESPPIRIIPLTNVTPSPTPYAIQQCAQKSLRNNPNTPYIQIGQCDQATQQCRCVGIPLVTDSTNSCKQPLIPSLADHPYDVYTIDRNAALQNRLTTLLAPQAESGGVSNPTQSHTFSCEANAAQAETRDPCQCPSACEVMNGDSDGADTLCSRPCTQSKTLDSLIQSVPTINLGVTPPSALCGTTPSKPPCPTPPKPCKWYRSRSLCNANRTFDFEIQGKVTPNHQAALRKTLSTLIETTSKSQVNTYNIVYKVSPSDIIWTPFSPTRIQLSIPLTPSYTTLTNQFANTASSTQLALAALHTPILKHLRDTGPTWTVTPMTGDLTEPTCKWKPTTTVKRDASGKCTPDGITIAKGDDDDDAENEGTCMRADVYNERYGNTRAPVPMNVIAPTPSPTWSTVKPFFNTSAQHSTKKLYAPVKKPDMGEMPLGAGLIYPAGV